MGVCTGHFLFLETSDPTDTSKIRLEEGLTARLASPVLKGNSKQCALRLWMHMNGEDVGSLRILRITSYEEEQDPEVLNTYSRAPGDVWLRGIVDLDYDKGDSFRDFRVSPDYHSILITFFSLFRSNFIK